MGAKDQPLVDLIPHLTMEPGEALATASQLAMALAGFASVVVAFRSGPLHDWTPIDKLRLRLLLGNSVVPSCVPRGHLFSA